MHAFGLVGCVWLELGAVQWAWPGDGGVACSFAGALALTLVLAPHPSRPGARAGLAPAAHAVGTQRARARWRVGLDGLCWAGLGVALQPWLATVAVVAVSWATGEAAIAHAPPPATAWRIVSLCVLAPAFEETLYRGRLFDAVARGASTPRSVIVTALFFALPHAGGLALFAVFLAGLALGATRAATGRLAPCIGLHTGFNLSALREALAAGMA